MCWDIEINLNSNNQQSIALRRDCKVSQSFIRETETCLSWKGFHTFTLVSKLLEGLEDQSSGKGTISFFGDSRYRNLTRSLAMAKLPAAL